MSITSERERPRILLKEFRRRRLPKRWNSLPYLQLPPQNRPVFICQRCNFPNPLCDLCPWCLHTCDVGAPVEVVRRRLSSPTLLNDTHKTQLARIERCGRGGDTFKFPNQATSLLGSARATRHRPDGVSEFENKTNIDSVRRRHRNARLYSATDVVATATVDATLQPFLSQIAATRLENLDRQRNLALSTITTPQSVRLPSPPSTPSRTSRPSSRRTPKACPRMSSQDVDVSSTSEPRSVPSEFSAPSPPLPHTPPQSLRRKRRMSVLRQRSSCSLRRRATTSGAGTHCRDGAISPSSPTSPKTARSTTSSPASHKGRSSTSIRFNTPPPGSSIDTIPLGHPQRPLYTAIRKNMSRPGSPAPSPTKIDAAFQTLVYERGTRSLDIEPVTQPFGSLSRSSYLVAARPALFPSQTGFSMSGETELRMDLARCRSMDGAPSDFAFREVKPDASMKRKVKNLGKTLKSLLRVKM